MSTNIYGSVGALKEPLDNEGTLTAQVYQVSERAGFHLYTDCQTVLARVLVDKGIIEVPVTRICNACRARKIAAAQK